jgi:tetratricopeptide (TPR) repeat protein
MSYMAFGAYEDAGEHLNDALQLNRVLGAREIEGNSHAMLSELAWRQGDGALALEHAQKALAISTDIGSRLHDADALWSMGNAYLTLGETENAANAFARSEAIARELSSMPLALNALEGQTRTALMRGDLHSAKRIADRLREEAGAGTDYAGTYEHLLRLTLYRVDQALGAASAAARLDEAHAALMAEAERIDDANLRCSFLARVDEHRKIVEHFQHRLDSRGAG